MDFTQYSQIMSYPQLSNSKSIIDIIGSQVESDADTIVDVDVSEIPHLPDEMMYDVMLLRFALRCVDDPFVYLSRVLPHVRAGGYVILQDYLMPERHQIADYMNGFIHIFDKKHRKSFAQYEWNGLLLDVGLHIDVSYQRTIHQPIRLWLERYQPDALDKQHAQILLVQAPEAVKDAMQITYAGTSYAEFVLRELICIAQKES